MSLVHITTSEAKAEHICILEQKIREHSIEFIMHLDHTSILHNYLWTESLLDS
jgi:hypothetical protein